MSPTLMPIRKTMRCDSGRSSLARGKLPLQANCAIDGVNRTCEFYKRTVTHDLDHPTLMLGD
jgi:hypothetical protein